MSTLAHRQTKIQEKRKQTPWRQFLMEIASWQPLQIHRYDGMTTRFPKTDRKPLFCNKQDFYENPIESEYVAGQSFYEQLRLFASKRPQMPLFINSFENINSDFSDVVFGAKNAYLSFSIGAEAENILYSSMVYDRVTNVIQSVHVENACDNIFQSLSVQQSMNIFWGKYIVSSNNLWFCSNMVGCSECINCDGLINQSYCINNQKHTAESYRQQKQALLKQLLSLESGWKQKRITGAIIQSPESTGQGIVSSSHIEHGFLVANVIRGRNLFLGTGGSDFFDGFDVGLNSSDLYGCCSVGNGSSHLYCCTNINTSTHCFYSSAIENCSFCIGCIGLKNKQFCIFNKQYTKEERYEKADQVFAQMDATPSNSPLSRGESQLGEFFPGSMNPFYFNDTAAYLIDNSFTKEEVIAAGYLRRDDPIKVDIPADMPVVKSDELDKYEGFRPHPNPLPAGEGEQDRTINADILKVVIQDEQGNYYRIIPMEYKFLVKHGLPLPRKHRLERMKENFRIA